MANFRTAKLTITDRLRIPDVNINLITIAEHKPTNGRIALERQAMKFDSGRGCSLDKFFFMGAKIA